MAMFTLRSAAIWVVLVQIAGCAGGSSGQGTIVATAAEPPSPDRLEFVSQFRKIDAAGKGLITAEEATAHYRKVFTELDKNRDGFLDVNELRTLLPIMGAKSGEELMAKLDRNGDNKLTLKEFLVITTWLFQLADGSSTMSLQQAENGFPPSVSKKKEPTLFGN
jgi:hypothetical protein